MIRSAWATLKLHRPELIFGVGFALAVAAWAGWAELTAAAVRPSAECFARWAETGGLDGPQPCHGEMRAWYIRIAAAGDLFRQFTEFLPFIAGALVGTPVVARELENRTAAMAWSMSPSRTRWLVRQILPIALVFAVAVAVAGFAASLVVHDEAFYGGGDSTHIDVRRIGTYGYGLVVRAIGILGLGVLVGTLFARQLPSFLLTVMLGLGFLNALEPLRNAWFASHPANLLDGSGFGVPTDWGYRRPDGSVLSNEAGTLLAPPEIAAQDEGLVQPFHVAEWLMAQGYEQVSLGIAIEQAFGWALYEAGAYLLLGLVAVGTAVLFVNRRRPG